MSETGDRRNEDSVYAEMLDLENKIMEARKILDGKDIARDKYGKVYIEYDPLIRAKLTEKEKEEIKEDVRHYEGLLHGYKIKEKESAKVFKQGDVIDLGDNNIIALNHEEQSIQIGNHKFTNFDEVISLLPENFREDSSRKSQIRGGIKLLYCISRHGQNTPQNLLIADLIAYYDEFKKNWTNRGIKDEGVDKLSFNRNDTTAVNSIFKRFGLTISLKLDKKIGEIKIKAV